MGLNHNSIFYKILAPNGTWQSGEYTVPSAQTCGGPGACGFSGGVVLGYKGKDCPNIFTCVLNVQSGLLAHPENYGTPRTSADAAAILFYALSGGLNHYPIFYKGNTTTQLFGCSARSYSSNDPIIMDYETTLNTLNASTNKTPAACQFNFQPDGYHYYMLAYKNNGSQNLKYAFSRDPGATAPYLSFNTPLTVPNALTNEGPGAACWTYSSYIYICFAYKGRSSDYLYYEIGRINNF